MGGLGWLSFLIVGLIAGWVAEKVMQRGHGLFENLVVGVVGAYLGALIFWVSGWRRPGSSARWSSPSWARWCSSPSWARCVSGARGGPARQRRQRFTAIRCGWKAAGKWLESGLPLFNMGLILNAGARVRARVRGR